MTQSQIRILAKEFNMSMQNQHNECCRKAIMKLTEDVANALCGWSKRFVRTEFLKRAGHPDHIE